MQSRILPLRNPSRSPASSGHLRRSTNVGHHNSRNFVMPPPAASPSGGVEETSTTSPAAAATTALADPASQPALHPRQSQRLLRIGVVSDIQYADIPDGKSYHGVPRYYRNSLAALSSVVIPEWASPEVAVDLAMHFGDILDGFQPKDRSLEVLGHVLDQFKALGRPVLHMLGNHCLYNLPRHVLNRQLGLGPDPAADPPTHSYYSHVPHPALRLIALDAYDVSILGWPKGHPLHEAAVQILDAKNPNKDQNSATGLAGLDARFVKFGGGVSDAQLRWLEAELAEAQKQGQRVIVSAHLPFCPGTCPPICLLWNYDAVLSRLQAAAPGTVVATIAGHTHQNGYRVDAAGIHHVVLPGLVETPPGRRCHGWLDVFTDRLVLNGVDTMQTLDMAYTSAGEAAAVATATAGGGGGGAAAATAAAASVASAASASAVAAAVR